MHGPCHARVLRLARRCQFVLACHPLTPIHSAACTHHAIHPRLPQYPALYADAANCPDEGKAKAFNCVQRAHQNSLEFLSSFYALLAAAGTKVRFGLALVV